MDYEWKLNVNPLDYTSADTAEVLDLGVKIWYYNYGDYDGYVSVVGDGVSTLATLDKLYPRNDEIDDAVADIATNTSGLADAVADIATNTSGLADAVADIATIESTYGLGVDQTWHDVTGSRVAETTYTNTNDKPIVVTVNTVNSSVSVPTEARASYTVGGISFIVISYRSVNPYAIATFIVPAGSTYEMSGLLTSTIVTWSELY